MERCRRRTADRLAIEFSSASNSKLTRGGSSTEYSMRKQTAAPFLQCLDDLDVNARQLHVAAQSKSNARMPEPRKLRAHFRIFLRKPVKCLFKNEDNGTRPNNSE